METTSDDEYEVALVHQRYFGAGIKRKRIQFVPSSTSEAAVKSLPATPSQSASDKYLSIVFKKPFPIERAASAPAAAVDGEEYGSSGEVTEDGQAAQPTCHICRKTIDDVATSTAHESSIAHQICLEHSYPPSHLDRRRKGLAVLQSQGWDLDSRKGLGAEGEGILYPIKAKENPERTGLGFDLKKQPIKVEKAAILDAGKVRIREQEGKKRAAKLRDAFYRTDDMEKYLGAEGQTNDSLDLAAFKRARR